MNGRNKFRLIIGGHAGETKVNGVRIDIIGDTIRPLPVDVRVFEEDTHLVLTVDPVMHYTDEHPIRVMTNILEAKSKKPGTIVAEGTSWYAVIHDLDSEPSCREEWIDDAYAASLQLAEKKGIARLGIPLLGTVHGSFKQRESMFSLLTQIRSQSFMQLKNLSILVPKGQVSELRTMFVDLTG